MTTEQSDKPCSHLYVHVPFCQMKCRYCAFFSVAKVDASLLDRYVDCLLLEFSLVGGTDRPVDTLYLGGGTPTLLGPVGIGALLDGIREAVPFDAEAEITLEVNPETVSKDDFQVYRGMGINRVSIGVQSFDNDELRFLGRIHDAGRARAAVDEALACDFRVSLDLIYGLPGQSQSGWCAQLESAAATGVGHISAYELTYEPGTPLHNEMGNSVGDRDDFFFATHEKLGSLGFQGYEVSSFALSPGARSRHNLATWAHRTYRGVGPGAHSFLMENGEFLRRWNLPDVDGYLEALEQGDKPPAESEILNTDALFLEMVMLGLRTASGINLEDCRKRVGSALTDQLVARAAPLINRHLLLLDENTCRPTLQGMALADRLAAELSL